MMSNHRWPLLLSSLLILCLGWVSGSRADTAPATAPLASSVSVKPKMMILLSKDHELFKKAYPDYTDLNGDGVLDTSYDNSIDYDGYFNNSKCYTHNGSYFSISGAASSHLCSSAWSGNFLNWATMTRMDLIRKVLYGGTRSSDPSSTTAATVLERVYLPSDTHSFAKSFKGTSAVAVSKVTPYSYTAVSLCSTSNQTNASGKDYVLAPGNTPLIRVASGSWLFWATGEVNQCDYGSNAYQPSSGSDLTMRVQVCDSADGRSDYCKTYPAGNRKPIGLLQTYGESKQIEFGLMTGSYYRNTRGGVLRQPLAAFNDSIKEVNTQTGQLLLPSTGMVKLINDLQIIKYRRGGYTDCGSSVDQVCFSWGNPLGEMFLEALRYISLSSSRTAQTDYASSTATNDSSYLGSSAFSDVSWGSDPWPATQNCASCSILILSSGVNSFDMDNLSGTALANVPSLSTTTLTNYVNSIGDKEGITNKNFLIGENGSSTNKFCDSKKVSTLYAAKGICPDAPGNAGGYSLAGLAYYAHKNDLKTVASGTQTVKTYGVSLSEALPTFAFQTSAGKVTVVPGCSNTGSNTNCSMNDLFMDTQSFNASGQLIAARFFVAWEDQRWGSDYDMDLVAEVNVCVGSACSPAIGSDQIKITTGVPYKYTAASMQIGLTVVGTSNDGTQWLQSVPAYDSSGSIQINNWQNISTLQVKSSPTPAYQVKTFTASSSTQISALPSPLFLAAKYGGYNDLDKSGDPANGSGDSREWDADGDGQPDNYYKVNNFSTLASNLNAVFAEVAKSVGYSAPVSSSSAVTKGARVYFSSYDNVNAWNGNLYSFKYNTTGQLQQEWNAVQQLRNLDPATRNIFSWDPDARTGVAFYAPGTSGASSTLSATQIARLTAALPTPNASINAQKAVSYYRGDHSNELINGGTFRSRLDRNGESTRLGDIVNSSPTYVGSTGFYYSDAMEADKYSDFVNSTDYQGRTPMVYVGSNDGALHGFNANNGNERFVYYPNAVMSTLNQMLDPNNYDKVHAFSVDGSPTAVDAYFSNSWHTVLSGGLRAGGKAIYALDVSATRFGDGRASTLVMWEYDETVDKALLPSGETNSTLGYTFSKPAIVKLNNGKWAAVFGNGYYSAAGKAVLYIVYLDAMGDNKWSATDVVRINTGVGSTSDLNGLSEIAPIDSNDDGRIDLVYAGDLKGNLWRFDLSGSSSSSWKVAGNAPVFTARDANNKVQPIVAQPEVGKISGGGYMVFFGTGKYHDKEDLTLPATSRQSFYAVKDTLAASPITLYRASLTEQTYTEFTDSAGASYRSVSQNTVSASKSGWFMDLAGTSVGERVIRGATLTRGRIVFTTLIPDPDQCGGKEFGWLMVVKAQDGSGSSSPVFDTNNDGVIDASDLVNSGSSKRSSDGLRQDTSAGALVLDNGNTQSVITIDQQGNPDTVEMSKGSTYRQQRVNWQEVYPYE